VTGCLFAIYLDLPARGGAGAGRLSDRYAPTVLIFTCSARSSASILLAMCAQSGAVVRPRASSPAFRGNISTARAYVADVTTEGSRARVRPKSAPPSDWASFRPILERVL